MIFIDNSNIIKNLDNCLSGTNDEIFGQYILDMFGKTKIINDIIDNSLDFLIACKKILKTVYI